MASLFADPKSVTPPAPAPMPARTAIWTIIGFWAFYFAIVTLRAALMGFEDQLEMIGRRLVVSTVGMGLTFGLYWALRPFAARTLKVQVAAAALLCIPFASLFGMFNWAAFYVYEPMETTKVVIRGTSNTVYTSNRWGEEAQLEAMKAPAATIADGTVTWYFFFAAWVSLHLAIGYAERVGTAERRASAFRAAARDAEIRALRYQVNPHFLFNTLNSLSTLVMRDQPEEAERMILNLATFFRTSLTADAADDLTLDEELRLQRLYLDIEAVRFPERLRVAIEIGRGLGDACVPGLILQPLIENAIKHGVSRARRPVTVTVSAIEIAPGRLELAVRDDGPSTDPDPVEGLFDQASRGTGTGLRNVQGRVIARYGDDATMVWGARRVEGYEVVMTLPLVRHGC